MAYMGWQATVQDGATGNALPLAEVTVRVGGPAGSLATIYSSNSGAAKNNPFFATSDGLAQFFAQPGTYYLVGALDGQTTDGWYITIDKPVMTRAEAVTSCAAGWRAKNGEAYDFGNRRYLGETGATDIPDLPGLVPAGEITPEHFGVIDGTDDQTQINLAIAYADSIGGGDVVLRGQTYWVGVTGSMSTVNGDANYRVNGRVTNPVRLVGVPRVTAIKVPVTDTRIAHVISSGRRIFGEAENPALSLYGIDVHGNLDWAVSVATPFEGGHGVNYSIPANGVMRGVTIHEVRVYDCWGYGIGLQGSGDNVTGGYLEDCHLREITIDRTGNDGIDQKDYSARSNGNTLMAVSVRRFGLRSASPGGTTLQGGLNFRGGFKITDFDVSDFSGDNHGIRDDADVVDHPSPNVWSNGTIRTETADSTFGVYSNIATDGLNDHQFSNITVRGCSVGFDIRTAYVQGSNLRSEDCGIGARLADRVAINGLQTRRCDTGLVITGTENLVTNFVSRQNTADLSISGNYNSIRGGSISRSGAAVATDTGTGNVIQGLFGLTTERVKTVSNVSISTTGVRNVIIPHGLYFTPSTDDFDVSLFRVTAVSDFEISSVVVVNTDATNVVVNVAVKVASATPGAVIGLRVRGLVKAT